jgi:hypothetical protein
MRYLVVWRAALIEWSDSDDFKNFSRHKLRPASHFAWIFEALSSPSCYLTGGFLYSPQTATRAATLASRKRPDSNGPSTGHCMKRARS